MKNIIRELYYGRLSGIGKPHKMTAAEEAIHQKIEAERQYFDSTLSTEDSARFEAFENLLAQAHDIDDLGTFEYAFQLGILFIFSAFVKEEY